MLPNGFSFLKPDLAKIFLYFYLYVLKLFLFNEAAYVQYPVSHPPSSPVLPNGFSFLKPDLAKIFLYFYLYVLKLFLFNVNLIYWSCYDSLIISLTSFLSITSVVKEMLTF